MRAVILNLITIGYSSSTDAIAFYADFQYLKHAHLAICRQVEKSCTLQPVNSLSHMLMKLINMV